MLHPSATLWACHVRLGERSAVVLIPEARAARLILAYAYPPASFMAAM